MTFLGRQIRLIHIRGGGGQGVQPPKLGRNTFHSGQFSERTIGNSSRKFTERLQLPPPKVCRPPTPMYRNSLYLEVTVI